MGPEKTVICDRSAFAKRSRRGRVYRPATARGMGGCAKSGAPQRLQWPPLTRGLRKAVGERQIRQQLLQITSSTAFGGYVGYADDPRRCFATPQCHLRWRTPSWLTPRHPFTLRGRQGVLLRQKPRKPPFVHWSLPFTHRPGGEKCDDRNILGGIDGKETTTPPSRHSAAHLPLHRGGLAVCGRRRANASHLSPSGTIDIFDISPGA